MVSMDSFAPADSAAADSPLPRDRILWNRRPAGRDSGDIDEIVIGAANVHVEQMDDRCWWIAVWRDDGSSWSGNFSADSRGRMRFVEAENNGIVWADDDSHEPPAR